MSIVLGGMIALKGRSKTWEVNVEQIGEGGKERAGYLGNSDKNSV